MRETVRPVVDAGLQPGVPVPATSATHSRIVIPNPRVLCEVRDLLFRSTFACPVWLQACLSGWIGDYVLVLLAEALDAELDFVAGLEKDWGLLAHAYARRCAGGDDVAGVQAHEAA